jgi:WD40 repeat protein
MQEKIEVFRFSKWGWACTAVGSCREIVSDGSLGPSSLQENENILVSASGDGSVKVWDLAAPPMQNPLKSLEEHTREV